ncbi:hypothetical protein ABBQ32_004056 [Trebouxia sp. C0010 RCD-2024]
MQGARAPKRLTEVVKVIDIARANNVSIMLTQFQAFKSGVLQVRHALLTGTGLGLDRLSLLLQIAPSEEESKKLKAYVEGPDRSLADLSSPERFLYVIGQVPRLRAKTAALIFREQFDSLVKDISSAMHVIRSAVQQIRKGPRLQRVIQGVLTVGNAVNVGTAYGNAQGIKLDSLLKLADVKVVTPASTMPAKSPDSSTAAGVAVAASVAQAAEQQARVIGVRTLLEFVAWLVCSSEQAGAMTVQKGKPVSQVGVSSRQGATFLTEELCDVGVAVRRLQVG